MALPNNQDSDTKIKILHFSSELYSSYRRVLPEPLMEGVKFIVAVNENFQNLDDNVDNIMGIFGQRRTENKKKHAP